MLLTIVAIRLLDRVGRRPLLLGGTAGMVVGLVVLAVSFIGQGDNIDHLHAGIAIAALCVYVGSFAIGLGPVFWLLISEIYPLRVRGSAMSLAGVANWIANFLVAISYLSILAAIGRPATFFGLAVDHPALVRVHAGAGAGDEEPVAVRDRDGPARRRRLRRQRSAPAAQRHA